MEKVVDKPSLIKAGNYRYERKFIYKHLSAEDLIATEVLCNSFCFREIFHRRTVNNIYFDDSSMSFYHQNVAGDDKRSKYRLRWYGDDFELIQKPVLEIKKKHGAVGDKLSFALSELNVNLKNTSLYKVQEGILNAISINNYTELGLHMQSLTPSLYNSYERRYFLSDCEKYRITIDYNMTFYNPQFEKFKLSETNLNDVVLELKYEVGDDKAAKKLTQELTARLSKNSKYVRGVQLINHLDDL